MQITESGGIVFNDEKGNTQYITEEELKELWNNKCKDSVVESVRNKLLERSNVGVKKYGEQLGNYKKYNFIQEMQNEALDFANYCEVELQKELTINQLVEKFSNDQELGKELRKLYGK